MSNLGFKRLFLIQLFRFKLIAEKNLTSSTFMFPDGQSTSQSTIAGRMISAIAHELPVKARYLKNKLLG
ncbi:hypothetical protein [Thermocoleostomius sinensis]|uniref:Uncharacterized protein n=1 Tax=Thermocoleostomius sinensis A174 TaxID=2016057 RepID=A0A9E9C6N8_9CYAN|nr:hypothetical protein [Thermocoleostomius sinensis]WAL59449.1 hypothetical protein OXH18_20080 [Thermocoleostomius sinensis A174]